MYSQNLISNKNQKQHPSYDSIRQLAIQSRKELQASHQNTHKSQLFDISIRPSSCNSNSSHQSNTQVYQVQKFIDESSNQNTQHNMIDSSIVNHSKKNVSNQVNQNSQENIEMKQYLENDKRFETQFVSNEASEEFDKHQYSKKSKQCSFPEGDDFGANYHTSHERQISILTKKLTSNSSVETSQLKQLIKLTQWTQLSEEQKYLKQRITQLSIVCRELKIQKRNNHQSKGKMLEKKHEKMLQKKEQNLQTHINQQKQKVNSLGTKYALLKNYYDAARKANPSNLNQIRQIPLKSPKSQRILFRTQLNEFLNRQQRKSIMQRRKEILKESINSMRINFSEKQQRIRQQKLCLKQQVEIIKLDILKLQKQNMKYSKIKVKSLNKLKSRNMSTKQTKYRKNSIVNNLEPKRPKRSSQSSYDSLNRNHSLKRQLEFGRYYHSPQTKRKLQVRQQYFSGNFKF